MSDQPPISTQPEAKFDPGQPHHAKPKLRPVRGVPAKVNDQVLLGLADARQISEQMVIVAPQVQVILPLLDGTRTIDQIVAEVGRGLTRDVAERLVAQLDSAGLLFGPRFDALLAKVHAEFDSTPILPPAATSHFADFLVMQETEGKATEEQKRELGPARLRGQFDAWMNQVLAEAEDPSFDDLPKAVIAPHIDYPRGWMNYAAIWGRMRVVDRPARVVILGTNHFGMATGVAACDKGYETPLGTSGVDRSMVDFMRSKLGDALFANRFDHEREHSIELQVPWIQHCIGPDDAGAHVPVFAALVHDPAVNNGESYDGKGVALQPFADALKRAIAELPGATLVVSSADLSHAGPMFGDQQPLAGDDEKAEAFRNRVLGHDREMLELVRQNKPGELVASLAWQQNPTRWCSTGNIVATLLATQPTEVEILNYAAAMDEQGMGLVSSAAAVMR